MSQHNSKKNGVSLVPNPEPPMILVETPYPRDNIVSDEFPKVLPIEQPQQQGGIGIGRGGGRRRRPCLLSQM